MNDEKKDKLREWAKELRKSLDLKKVSTEIENKIRELDVYKSAKTVMSYMAKDLEISLNGLFQDGSKSWFLPVVLENETAKRRNGETAKQRNGETAKEQIVIAPFFPKITKLIKNKFNILEPEIIGVNFFNQIEKKINLDLILVPGLCFDKEGNRIGFGGGFYDNFLKLNPNSFKIGCCPKECLVDNLPVDGWDIKVDLVIT